MTVIKDAIKKIQVQRKGVRDTSYKEGLKDAIYILESMLQQEREQMERCFDAGQKYGSDNVGFATGRVSKYDIDSTDFDTFFTTQFNSK